MQNPIDEIVVRYSVEAGNGYPAELLSFEALGLPELSNEGWFADLRKSAPEKFRDLTAKLQAMKKAIREMAEKKSPFLKKFNDQYDKLTDEEKMALTATQQAAWARNVTTQSANALAVHNQHHS